MIKHYLWTTPNGYKTKIALCEMDIAHEDIWVNIGKDEQFSDDFLKIAPNNKIPAIYDEEADLALMESGAILQYLGEKSGKFWGNSPNERAKINQWLHWQMGGVGPIFGQAYHFAKIAPKGNDYAIERFMTETHRILRVLNDALERNDYIAGSYSIADMAIFPWVRNIGQLDEALLQERENITNWIARNNDRPLTAQALNAKPNE